MPRRSFSSTASPSRFYRWASDFESELRLSFSFPLTSEFRAPLIAHQNPRRRPIHPFRRGGGALEMQGRRPQATNRGRLPAACVSASACRLSLALCLTSAFGISGGSVAGLQRVAASARLFSDACLRTTTREKFEELCEDFWEQALSPVKEVLAHSGMKIDDIYAVELIGGATRVPKLQAKLQQFLGRSELDKHLDADEAIVLGASLHAANLSDVIKLNRKLGMIDGSTYGFVLEIDGPDYVKDESIDQVLVPRMKKMPIKMFRSIRHTMDFDVSLNYDKAYELPPGV